MRRKTSYFNWKSYIGAFLIFGVLGLLPPLMFGGMEILQLPETRRYILWYVLYWVGVTIVFSIVTAYQKYSAFDKPMNLLNEATERVAKGDFAVYLQPVHPHGKKDYIDYMFEDFNKMVEELSSIDTLKNDFIADVSHEIKTPLAVIQNYITALKQPELSDETKKEYMDTIFESTQKLSELVSNILRLNKLENQKIVPQQSTYNLGRQISECIFRMEELWEKKSIELQVELEERVMLTADESILELVWNNLLSNAWKFTEAGGCVKVTLGSDADTITVVVRDNGCGMDEKTKKHVFDKFYQGDTSHSTEGNGLGMALVMRAVEMLDGRIEVESESGKGTAFIVKLKKS